MERKNEAGFSLVEVLVAITILAVMVLPICSALVMSVRMNDRTDALMHAQLAVSSAVETLMAEGIPEAVADEIPEGEASITYGSDRFPEVEITVEPVKNDADILYYNVTVVSLDKLVTVKTSVKGVAG